MADDHPIAPSGWVPRPHPTACPAIFVQPDGTHPVWTGNYVNPNSGHLNATGAAQNGYLFWDQVHPTETGHMAIASTALQSLGVAVG